MNYIERELLLIGIDGCISSLHVQAKGDPVQEAAIKLVETTRDYIASLSAADVAPVRHETPMLRYRPKRHEIYDEYGLNENGEMLYVKRTILDEKNYAMYCPACGKRLCSRFKNFCPNCGAKMDGGKA